MSKADRHGLQQAKYDRAKATHERQLREAKAAHDKAMAKAAAKLADAKNRMDKLGERGVIRRIKK